MKEIMGVSRKMDQLGRVCVPKSMRNICNIHPGDLMEMSVCDGILEIKRFVPRTDPFKSLLQELVQTSSDATHTRIFIIDNNEILISSVKAKELTEWVDCIKKIIKTHDDYQCDQKIQIFNHQFLLLKISMSMQLVVQYDAEISKEEYIVLHTCMKMIKHFENWLSINLTPKEKGE